jgi:hypothetical protein
MQHTRFQIDLVPAQGDIRVEYILHVLTVRIKHCLYSTQGAIGLLQARTNI